MGSGWPTSGVHIDLVFTAPDGTALNPKRTGRTLDIEVVITLLEQAGIEPDESVRRASQAIHKRQKSVRIAQKERKRRLLQRAVSPRFGGRN